MKNNYCYNKKTQNQKIDSNFRRPYFYDYMKVGGVSFKMVAKHNHNGIDPYKIVLD